MISKFQNVFRDFQIICPTHCTKHIAEIKENFPEKYISGGVGAVLII